MDRDTLEYYDRNASEIADRYESANDGIASLFPFVFEKGERVLDLGAGTCRDAAVLLGLGIDVHAVEPSSGLRERAAALHPELAGRIFDGALPDGLPAQVAGPYDGILVSAVLMHIADADLFDAAFAIRERLKAGGKLLVSIPIHRGDVLPRGDRDAAGRLMIMRSPARLKLLFERLGFALESEWSSADSLGRPDVAWATLYFRYNGTAPRPIDRIESILNADRKVATYKLALLRALCDTALTSWSQAGGGHRGLLAHARVRFAQALRARGEPPRRLPMAGHSRRTAAKLGETAAELLHRSDRVHGEHPRNRPLGAVTWPEPSRS